MYVLNLSSNDYANMSHENANALRSAGVKCDDICMSLHPFGYETQSARRTHLWVKDHFMIYDVIQIFHTDETLYELVKSHPNVVIYHTGTRYRENKEYFDRIFEGRKIITDQCEFLLHNHEFIYLAPHTNLKPTNKEIGKLIVGHYPSNQEVKGTKDIERMLKPFMNDFDVRIDTTKVSHEDNLKRVSDCHIYIELFKPELNGNPYGCFGVSAFEATALGCLVLTNNINRAAYENVYGMSPFLITNTEQIFMNTLISLHDREIYEIAKESFHAGFYAKHGATETGLRIKNILNEGK
jgi:hypothetical protein